jgi:cell division protein FtsL
MNTEEKLFSLMGLADEQSKVNQALLQEFARTLKLSNDADRAELKKEREQIIQTYRRMVSRIEALQSMRWKWIVTTFFACFCLVAVSLGGVYFYTEMLSDDITRMRLTISQLKSEAGEAEVYTCKRDNIDYPCVRVMKSWGGYGTVGDLFIIDPK